jgi:D-sedoheptulose 7-phosphate isomerase
MLNQTCLDWSRQPGAIASVPSSAKRAPGSVGVDLLSRAVHEVNSSRRCDIAQPPSHPQDYLSEVATIAASIDHQQIERLAHALAALREREGRLFFLGVGGSAANCSHAVNDFRKLCGIEAYAPVDNVSELTARTNDEGWDTVFAEWLKGSRARADDAVFVFSVGGGNAAKKVSMNIVAALDTAKDRSMKIFGVVGKRDGHAASVGDEVVVIPTVNPDRVTPHAEAFQAVVWHCLVSHPVLQTNATKW